MTGRPASARETWRRRHRCVRPAPAGGPAWVRGRRRRRDRAGPAPAHRSPSGSASWAWPLIVGERRWPAGVWGGTFPRAQAPGLSAGRAAPCTSPGRAGACARTARSPPLPAGNRRTARLPQPTWPRRCRPRPSRCRARRRRHGSPGSGSGAASARRRRPRRRRPPDPRTAARRRPQARTQAHRPPPVAAAAHRPRRRARPRRPPTRCRPAPTAAPPSTGRRPRPASRRQSPAPPPRKPPPAERSRRTRRPPPAPAPDRSQSPDPSGRDHRVGSGMVWVVLGFLVIVFLTVVAPLMRQRAVVAARARRLSALQRERGSQVITIIHRQEQIGLFGVPLVRFIDIDDSEQVLRAIRMTPDDRPIDLVLHTPGGLVLAAEQIAHAVRDHPARVTVLVPHYAMSGGTLIALAADEIVMDAHAVLGPVDPQLGDMPAASILRVAAAKEPAQIDDRFLVLADVAEKARRQVLAFVTDLLDDRMPAEEAGRLAELLAGGYFTHDFPITVHRARALGLAVGPDLPALVYELMALFPQPARGRPSVTSLPLPAPGPGPGRMPPPRVG